MRNITNSLVKTIRSNGSLFRIFKPNNFRDVRNLYEDEAIMDMTFNSYKILASTCCDKSYQSLPIDMTKDKYIGRYQLGLN